MLCPSSSTATGTIILQGDRSQILLMCILETIKMFPVITQAFMVDCVCNVMAHAQKPDFVFRRNGRVHLNRWGRQFSRLLTAEVCASAVVMLDTPCSEVVWRVLATHCIRQFPLHFPSRASPRAITFQLDCTNTTKLELCLYESVYTNAYADFMAHSSQRGCPSK